jgi:hypothetical protein
LSISKKRLCFRAASNFRLGLRKYLIVTKMTKMIKNSNTKRSSQTMVMPPSTFNYYTNWKEKSFILSTL